LCWPCHTPGIVVQLLQSRLLIVHEVQQPVASQKLGWAAEVSWIHQTRPVFFEGCGVWYKRDVVATDMDGPWMAVEFLYCLINQRFVTYSFEPIICPEGISPSSWPSKYSTVPSFSWTLPFAPGPVVQPGTPTETHWTCAKSQRSMVGGGRRFTVSPRPGTKPFQEVYHVLMMASYDGFNMFESCLEPSTLWCSQL
jgi:hypothetical protein